LLSVIQQSVIMSRQGVDIPLFENLGFKKAGNGKPASQTESANSEPKPTRAARRRARSEAPATNPESGETQSEPKT
jgi:YidC/Oxa1 family membrane protein insertase